MWQALAESFLFGIGLSMDAMAVSIVLSTTGGSAFTRKKMLLTAFLFGAFQAGMPLAGWFLCTSCNPSLQSWGKWIAFLLLGGIGGKMIYDGLKKKEEEPPPSVTLRQLILLAFATSIDAFLIGVSYACLGRTSILLDVTVIGLTTFVISAIACTAGRFLGRFLGERCTIAGGLILLGLGLKVLFLG